MSEQNYWFIRQGEKTAIHYEHASLRYSAISIGFGISQDLKGMNDRGKIARIVGGRVAGQVDNFVNEIVEGDIALLQFRDPNQHRSNYRYGIGSIVGGYKMLCDITKNHGLVDPKRPARSIKWLQEKLKEADFGDVLDYWVRRHGTVLHVHKGQPKHDALIKKIDSILQTP